MKQVFHTSSPTKTQELAHSFAASLVPGSVLALSGPLGAGKTTFIQALAQGLGVTQRLTSPTFVILKQYPSPQLPGFFYHLDLYRLTATDDLNSLGLKELLVESGHIFAIEWPQIALSLLPKDTYYFDFHSTGELNRQITLTRDESLS